MRLFPGRGGLLGMVAGPIVWTLHFLACYVIVSLACAAPGSQHMALPAIAAATAVSLAALTILGTASFRRWRAARQEEQGAATEPFLALVTLMLSLLSALAVFMVALPSAMLPSCAA